MLHSKYPTFELTYKHGLKNVAESNTDFGMVEASIQQSKSINLIDKVAYHIGGGKFTNNNSLYFADYKSFNTQPFYFIGNSSITSYKASTIDSSFAHASASCCAIKTHYSFFIKLE